MGVNILINPVDAPYIVKIQFSKIHPPLLDVLAWQTEGKNPVAMRQNKGLEKNKSFEIIIIFFKLTVLYWYTFSSENLNGFPFHWR